MRLRIVHCIAAIACLGFPVAGTAAQDFVADSTMLPKLQYAALDWGDYDNDGDLDLAYAGMMHGGTNVCDIYRNDAGVFTAIGAGLLGVRSGCVIWGDYDADDDLDLLVTGYSSAPVHVARIYRNDNGSFTDIAAGLTGAALSGADWGDFDQDGDLDLIVTGSSDAGNVTTLYRNDGADTFVPVAGNLPGIGLGSSVDWGDYDGDGDLDLLFLGQENVSGLPRTLVYRNDDGVFAHVSAGLFPLWSGRASWGDYNLDGRLDILAAGLDSSGVAVHTFVYRNDGAGAFTDTHANLDGSGEGGAIEWADANADGQPDILMMAANFGQTLVWYHVSDSTYVEAGLGLPHGCCGDIRWGDFDADGRLDFAVTITEFDHTAAYRNTMPGVNTPPVAPESLDAVVTGSEVVLMWSGGSDAETATPGLTYNVRVGTSPGSSDVMPAMADAASGQRRIADFGNVWSSQSWTLRDLPPGVYFWSVQSIDPGFAGSAFAAERSFTVGEACPVVATGDVNLSGSITSADIIGLVNFVFKGGGVPQPCVASGDVNCSGEVTSADIIALVGFVFKGGAGPCDVCPLIPGTWNCP